MIFVSYASEVRIVLQSHSRYSYAFQQESFEKKEELTYVTNFRDCINHVFTWESSID